MLGRLIFIRSVSTKIVFIDLRKLGHKDDIETLFVAQLLGSNWGRSCSWGDGLSFILCDSEPSWYSYKWWEEVLRYLHRINFFTISTSIIEFGIGIDACLSWHEINWKKWRGTWVVAVQWNDWLSKPFPRQSSPLDQIELNVEASEVNLHVDYFKCEYLKIVPTQIRRQCYNKRVPTTNQSFHDHNLQF